MQIKDLFERNIHRAINGVIKADQSDEANVWQELDEYVITRELDGHLRQFFDTYLNALDHPEHASGNVGVWVSGFFGSGKSHFIKILSYLLANREVSQAGETRRAQDFFEQKITDAMLSADIARAITGETDVLLFNIDSKADSDHSRDAILKVFLKVFNEMRGFSPDHPHIANMEQELSEKGALNAFHEAFEAEAGSSWLAERDGYTFYSDAVAKAYSKAMGQSVGGADAWLERLERDFNAWLSVENFCRMIRTYLDQRGNKHRIVFLVDEVGQFIGENTQLMLNLQTITENLGTICDGRAWVIVTSQEDIDAVVGQLRSGTANDFSKIQGRFRTRLSLSSANVDEVIQKRLLKKTPEAADELRTLYRGRADVLKHQLSFSNTGRTFKAYADEDDFAAVYPFAPYQFNLVQSIFESVRKAGATGLHLARGERSLLDAFQSAAKAVGESEPGVLVPLHSFYPSIESFLEGVVKSTIENSRTNPSLEPFDVEVLQTLFLIRYVEEIPGNVDNLITLFVDQIDADRKALREKIEGSLQRLEGQTLVSRNGDNFFFLTNEERDISREIKNVELTAAEEAKKLGEFVFERVLGGLRKHTFADNGNVFQLNLSCDQHLHGKNNDDGLQVSVITPLIDDYSDWTDAKCILASNDHGGQVILKLPDDPRLASELRQFIQTDKFLIRRNDASLADTAKRIVRDRSDENRQRGERIRHMLEQLLSDATPFAAGHQPALSTSSAQKLVTDVLDDLIRNTFSKLSFIEHPTPNPQAEIQAQLDDPSTLTLDLGSAETPNAKALKEVSQFIELSTQQHRQIVLNDLATSQFARRPYGWQGWETVLLIVRLVKAGELSLVTNNSVIPASKLWEHLNPPSRWRNVIVQRRKALASTEIQSARDLARDLFGALPPSDEDRLHAAIRSSLDGWRQEFEQWKSLATSAGFPGKQEASDGADLCRKLLDAPDDSYASIGLFRKHADDLREAADAHEELKHFFTSQKPVWERLTKALQTFEPNRSALDKDEPAKQALSRLHEIRNAPAPYGLLREVEALVATVDKANNAAVDKARQVALKHIDSQIERVQADLDAAEADADTRNRSLIKLQTLRKGAETNTSIAHLHQLSSTARDEADTAIERLATLAPDKGEDGKSIADAPVSKKLKSIQPIFAASLKQGYIEDAEAAEDYLKRLREQITQALNQGKRVDIR